MFLNFLLIFILHAVKLSNSVELRSVLKMEILNSGFHREIFYRLRFAPVVACDVLLVQDIPSSVYVDTDQLSNLNRFNKLRTFVDSFVDVEQPTAKSAPFKVYIYERLRKNLNITLPVHFRYHAPSDRKYNRVEIDSPKVFIANCHMKGKTLQLPCVNSSSIDDFSEIQSVSTCPWTEIDVAQITLSFLIPVGNINSYYYVMPVTIFLSWMGCLFLTYVIIKKSREMNKKHL